MRRNIFDYDSGSYLYSASDRYAMDSDGHMMSRVSDRYAMDMDTGDLHHVSSWDTDDDYRHNDDNDRNNWWE